MAAPPSQNIFIEVLRETFPKKLRFDKPCQILYAQCFSVSKRYKHKKYIPRSEVEDVLNEYTLMPGRPWLQLPIIRQVLCVRIANAVRTASGKQSWLYTRGVEEEHTKIQTWMDQQHKTASAKASSLSKRRRSAYAPPASPSASSSSPGASSASAAAAMKYANMVERERFDKEVLGSFRVATTYQRMVRAGVCAAFLLLLLTFASVNTDYVVYLYCRYWWRMDRAAIMNWMREVTQRHTAADIPDAYKSLLPSPCFSYKNEAGEVCYGVNITELVSVEKGVTVVCVPCPQVGEKKFFEQVGQVAGICDSVVVEGVSFEDVDRISPAGFLPLKDNTFPALGVHHRFLDILRMTDAEPPMLFPGGAKVSWKAWLQQVFLPFELRCVYNPTQLSATKGEARVGWGRLRDVIETHAAEVTATAGKGTAPSYVIALPWTVNQIVNIEASLVKHGFKVKNVFPLHWIGEDHMGQCFCDYHNIARPEGAAVGSAKE